MAKSNATVCSTILKGTAQFVIMNKLAVRSLSEKYLWPRLLHLTEVRGQVFSVLGSLSKKILDTPRLIWFMAISRNNPTSSALLITCDMKFVDRSCVTNQRNISSFYECLSSSYGLLLTQPLAKNKLSSFNITGCRFLI